MAMTTGELANLSWGGANPQSAVTTALDFQRFTLNGTVETFNEQIFQGTTPNVLQGLADHTVSLDAIWQTKPIGSNGLLTWSNGYALNIEEWSLNLTVPDYRTPVFNATAPSSAQYIVAKHFTATVDILAFLDDATAVPQIPISADPSAIQLRFSTAAEGRYDGNVTLNSIVPTGGPGQVNQVRIQAQWDGSLSATGSGAILPTGQFSPGGFTQCVLTPSSGLTYTGSAALITFNQTCNVSQPNRVSIGGRFTGNLVPA